MPPSDAPRTKTLPTGKRWSHRHVEKPTLPEMAAVRPPTPAATVRIPREEVELARPAPVVSAPPSEINREPSPAETRMLSSRRPLVSLDSIDLHEDEDVPTAVGAWKVGPLSDSYYRRDRAALVRLDGNAPGMTEMLPQKSVRLGRSRDIEVRVDDEGVSRFHAALHFELGDYTIIDLGSRNGTVVDGEVVTKRRLKDGDIIQLGPRVTYRFTLMDERQAGVMQQLYETSIKDPLTGAYNRQHLEERLAAEIAFGVRHKVDVSVLMMDIDYFKKINDTHGHQAGDAVLQFVTALVQSRLRTEDVFARYGGEEFVVLLRGIDIAGAARAGERLRAVVSASCPSFGGTLIPVSVSVGCAALAETKEQSSEELVGIADRRLYVAKQAGRNRVAATDDGKPLAPSLIAPTRRTASR